MKTHTHGTEWENPPRKSYMLLWYRGDHEGLKGISRRWIPQRVREVLRGRFKPPALNRPREQNHSQTSKHREKEDRDGRGATDRWKKDWRERVRQQRGFIWLWVISCSLNAMLAVYKDPTPHMLYFPHKQRAEPSLSSEQPYIMKGKPREAVRECAFMWRKASPLLPGAISPSYQSSFVLVSLVIAVNYVSMAET